MARKRSIQREANQGGGCAASTAPDNRESCLHFDPAKALVMRVLGDFVAEGLAEWETRDTGDIELRWLTGETFLLSDRTIMRLK